VDPSSVVANLSMIPSHFEFFVVLLFGLPAMTFLAMKFWIAGRSTRAQRVTNWFVPTDLESESARMHYSMQHQSGAPRVHRHLRHADAVKNSSSKRST
jgi:hypothetical protein